MDRQLLANILRLALLFTSLRCASPAPNNRPIVGVLSMPTASVHNANLTGYGTSFIAASYIKWVESAGARVLPIPFDSTPAELRASFNSVNGLLLTGGDADIYDGPFAAAATSLLDMATNSSRRGAAFPVWGTCLGFEQLAVYLAGEHVLGKVDAEHLFLPLELTAGAQDSAMLRSMPPEVLSSLKRKNLTVNLHSDSLLLDGYRASAKLQQAVDVLATNHDRDGKRFVSLMAGRSLPFHAAQFHPEKNGFEFDQAWDASAVEIHEESGIRMAQHFANFFVNLTRQNTNLPSDMHWLESRLIYNFAPVYTSKVMPGLNLWEQAYFFK